MVQYVQDREDGRGAPTSFTVLTPRLETLAGVIGEFTNWPAVCTHVLSGRPLEKLARRKGPPISSPRDADLWNHYNAIWNHRIYTRYGEIPAGGVVLDIGANIGLFGLFAARTAGVVHAFEPSSRNFGFLKANTARTPNVRAHHAAVAGRPGPAWLDDGGGPTACHLTMARASERVDCTTLRDIFEEQKIDRCGFLKLDCEGSEFDILLNAEPEILARIDQLVMEYHDHLSAFSHRDLEQRLAAAGFEVITYGDSGSFGMLAAGR